MRRLRIPDEVAGLIRGLHPDLKRKVRSALDDILTDPTVGKALREELAGLRSCRVARFRIIYRVAGGRHRSRRRRPAPDDLRGNLAQSPTLAAGVGRGNPQREG